MSHTIVRATKSVLTAAAIAAAGLGIALGSATAAQAEPKSFQQSESSLKMMCDRYGGSFIGSSEKAGAVCAWKDGSDTVCDKKQNCTIVEPKSARVQPDLSPISAAEILG